MNNWGIPNRGDAADDAAIREVLNGYCHLIDAYADEELLELFTPDGEWRLPAKEPLRGREQIAGFLRGRSRDSIGRHVVSNIVVDIEGPGRARTVCYYVVCKSPPEGVTGHAFVPSVLGEYHDEFRFEQGRWRIASRDTRHVFRPS